jgi:uncharacterized protein YuzE
MNELTFKGIKPLLSYLLKHKYLCTIYDEKADVLYVHFKENAVSDDSELTKDDLIIRYEGEVVVSNTVLNASKRK